MVEKNTCCGFLDCERKVSLFIWKKYCYDPRPKNKFQILFAEQKHIKNWQKHILLSYLSISNSLNFLRNFKELINRPAQEDFIKKLAGTYKKLADKY